MPPPIDLTGDEFGRLRVDRRAVNGPWGHARWWCWCAPDLGGCGKRVKAYAHHLKAGRTTSCGCYRAEVGRAKLAGARKPPPVKRKK